MRLVSRRATVALLAAAVTAGATALPVYASPAGAPLQAAKPDPAAPPSVAAAAAPSAGSTVRLVVGVKPGTDVTAPVRRLSGMSGVRTFDVDSVDQRTLTTINATTVEVPAARSAAVIARLRKDAGVSYVETDGSMRLFDVTPNDPVYNQSRQPELSKLNVPTAWDTTTGQAVTVAVVDSGVSNVGDLAGAVQPNGWNFVKGNNKPVDDNGHGTEVASLIAARGNNGVGMAGICWSCKILPVKVTDAAGDATFSNVARGITYAADHGAKIINLSLGGPPAQVVQIAVAHAVQKGALVVAAAGNDGTATRNYPAAYADVLGVGGTGFIDEAAGTYDVTSDARVSFSNYGSTWVDVAAPGCATVMDRFGAYPKLLSCGTSFSSPLVAGVAALVKSNNPGYSGWSLQNSIAHTARPVGDWVKWGVVDAPPALALHTDATPPTITGATPVQNTRVRSAFTVTANGVSDAWSGVRNVALYVDGKYYAQDVTAPYQIRYDSAKRNGVINLQLKVWDKAGNMAVLARTVTADNVLPAVTITKAPKNKAKVKGIVKIAVAASDKYGINRVELLINGKIVQTDKAAPYAFSITAKKQPKNMKVQVRAYDRTGNVRYAPARTWTR